MHKKTYKIIKNLGFGDEVIKSLKQSQKDARFNKKILNDLKKLGIPDAALKQIKLLENKSVRNKSNLTNIELINSLAKRCKRSFDAFANKGGKAKIVFWKNKWSMKNCILFVNLLVMNGAKLDYVLLFILMELHFGTYLLIKLI